jgi:hypothetical protein
MVGQNSTILMPGEELQIYSGIGSFSLESRPKISVYGKPIPIEADGIAVYKIKTLSKPGKYYVPVKINYIDQEGRQQTVEREIEYTVANIQKQ